MTETSTGTNVLITDEMVETAAAAIWNRSAREFDGCPLWEGRLPSNIRHSVRRDARAALEAAAPQIAAQALREAADWLDAVRADLDAVSRLGDELEERVSSQIGRSVLAISSDLSDAHDALNGTAPDRLDRMERALRAVTLMHTPELRELRTIDGFDSIGFCRACGLEWGDDGCPTVTTIEEVLG